MCVGERERDRERERERGEKVEGEGERCTQSERGWKEGRNEGMSWQLWERREKERLEQDEKKNRKK